LDQTYGIHKNYLNRRRLETSEFV